MIAELHQKIKAAYAAGAKWRHPQAEPVATQPLLSTPRLMHHQQSIICLGASTGGTAAIQEFLSTMPNDCPPIIMVQHMPQGFTAAFAEHLDTVSTCSVREARHHDYLRPGLALLAPGNQHLRLNYEQEHYLVELDDSPPVNCHRPSVDILFHSAASLLGPNSVGVILTGMGRDGAAGLLAMRQAGATTLAQDEASSVVYGMPKAALEIGAVDRGTALAHLGIMSLRQARHQGREYAK